MGIQIGSGKWNDPGVGMADTVDGLMNMFSGPRRNLARGGTSDTGERGPVERPGGPEALSSPQIGGSFISWLRSQGFPEAMIQMILGDPAMTAQYFDMYKMAQEGERSRARERQQSPAKGSVSSGGDRSYSGDTLRPRGAMERLGYRKVSGPNVYNDLSKH